MRRIIEENMYAILANYLLKMKIILYFIVLVTINVDYNIMLYLMLNVIWRKTLFLILWTS